MSFAIEERLARARLMPVTVLPAAGDALAVARALLSGGLPVMEITFRTEAAAEAIALVRQAFPEMLVGAGTVTAPSQVEKAALAGGEFVVSPGLSAAVVREAREAGIAVFPGVCTPTEAMAAMEQGLETVKFFPAEQYGGVSAVRALAAPFPQLRFIPSGGVNGQNVREYLACRAVLACGGSWMVREELIRAGRLDEIERLTAQAVALAGGKA